MSSSEEFLPNCSCDPISPTTDCYPEKCTEFFSVFFFLQTMLLIFFTLLYWTVESQVSGKGNLRRFILGCAVFAQGAKVLRTGLLLNPVNRYTLDTFIFALYNIHLCVGSFGFVSLLFIWARLHHDMVPGKKVFGKLLPLYIFVLVIIFIFYFLQVVLSSVQGGETISFACTYATGIVTFLMGASYIIYGIRLWKPFVVNADRRNIFIKMFLSAFVSSIVIIILDVFLIAFNIAGFNLTTTQFLIRHSVYETMYILLFLSFSAGFAAHYLQSVVRRMNERVSTHFGRHREQTPNPSDDKKQFPAGEKKQDSQGRPNSDIIKQFSAAEGLQDSQGSENPESP